MSALTGWVHCPRCAADLVTGPVGPSGEVRLHCPACGLVLYDNPAPTATAIVTRRDGAILFTRRAIEPALGMLDLPGGFIEAGESPELAVRRELMEETGLEIELTGYLGTFPDRYGEGAHTLNIYFTAVVSGGVACAADDVSELVWIAPGELPARSEIAFANSVEALERALGYPLPGTV